MIQRIQTLFENIQLLRRNKLQKKNILPGKLLSLINTSVIPPPSIKELEMNSINRSDLEGKIFKEGEAEGEVTQLSFHVRSWLIDLRFPLTKKSSPVGGAHHNLKRTYLEIDLTDQKVSFLSIGEHVNDYSIKNRQYNNMKPYRQDLSSCTTRRKGL